MTVGPCITLQGDGFGRIWNSTPKATQEGLISTFTSEGSSFTGAAFSAGSENIAVVDQRGQIYVLRIKSNRFSLLTRAGQPCESVIFSRRNKKEVLVAFADHAVRSYSIDQGQLQGTLKGHRTPLTSLSVRPTVDELLTCSSDGIVCWDMRRLVRRRTLGGGPMGALCALFTEDGEFMVTAFRDDTIWVWDASSLTLRYRVKLPFASAAPSALTAIAVSPDSTTLVAAGATPLLYVYDFSRGFLRHAVQLPSKFALRGVRSINFAPDSSTLTVLCQDGSVLLVDVTEGRIEAMIPAADPKAAALQVAIDERCNFAALCCLDGRMRLYDLGLLRQTYAAVKGSAAYCLQVLSPEELKAPAPESAEQLAEGGVPVPPADTTPGVTMGMQLSEGHVTNLVGSLVPRRGEMKGWRAEAAPAAMFRAPVDGSAPAAPAAAPPSKARKAAKPNAGLPGSLTLSKLRSLLEGFGEYPDKYRTLIWRRLLALPENTGAFQALASRGLHPALEDLGDRYPLPDRALLSRLARTLSHLAHWCPALAEVPYLPSLAFPFVKLFGADELGCFEALASLWLHWFRGWLDHFPAPPVALLSRWEAVLAHRDPELHQVLLQRGGGVQGHLWCLLQTALSEVLTRKEWLKVWDHALTGGPHFLGCFLVAYLTYYRDILIQVRAEEQVSIFLRRPNALDLNAVIKGAYDIRMRTPEALLPPVRARETLPKETATYPPYTAFPVAAVDLASRERAKILEQEKDLARRRVLVQELEARGRSLAAQEQAWVGERARLAELEADRRQALRAQEDALLRERISLEDRARGERLKQVSTVEDAYRTNLQRLRADWQVELERLRADIEHKQRLMEMEMRSKKEEEVVAQLEIQAQQRVWAIEEEASRAAAAQRLRTAVDAAQVDEWALKSKAQAAWEREDAESRALMEAEGARKARMMRLETELAARDQTDVLLTKKKIATESNLEAIETARRLRKIEEKAKLEESEKEAAKRARAALRSGQDREHFTRELQTLHAAQEAKAAANRAALEESEALRRAERTLREERGDEVEHAMRRRELGSQLDEYRRNADRESAREERETRRLLEVLEEERRRDRDLELELRLKEEELGSRLAHARTVGERQTAAEEDERRKFGQMREALRNRVAQEDGEARRRHEEAMSALALEREKQLLELDALWRKTAASEELRAIAGQKAALDKDLERRAREQVERERMLALEVAALKKKVADKDIGGAIDAAKGFSPDDAMARILGGDRALIEAMLAGAGGGGKGHRAPVDSDDSVSITHITADDAGTTPSSPATTATATATTDASSAMPRPRHARAPAAAYGSSGSSGGTPSSGSVSADTRDLLRSRGRGPRPAPVRPSRRRGEASSDSPSASVLTEELTRGGTTAVPGRSDYSLGYDALESSDSLMAPPPAATGKEAPFKSVPAPSARTGPSAPPTRGGARAAGPSHPPPEPEPEDLEYCDLMERMRTLLEAPPPAGSPPFTVSATTAFRRGGPVEAGDEAESGGAGGALGADPEGESPMADPTPRHTQAYLQAREILARHRSASGSASAAASESTAASNSEY